MPAHRPSWEKTHAVSRQMALMLTYERLRELLHYDPITGIFTWRAKPSRKTNVSAPVGWICGDGYLMVAIARKTYRQHRLAWLYMTGGWPNGEIDHKDGDRRNNRWENLRDVTRSENTQNHRFARSDSTTGLLGVERKRDKFQARIKAHGKRRSLGTFATAEEAHQAYLVAKRALHVACMV